MSEKVETIRLVIDPTELCKVVENMTAGMDVQSAIFGEVMAERIRQDAQWGGPGHDDEINSGWDWANYVMHQAGRAYEKAVGNDSDGEPWRTRMVKIAALAFAAIESHDRVMEKAAHDEQLAQIASDGEPR